MCYFEQTRWSCGYWRWGHFRQQCNKEYRMGETCGLKLVYETKVEPNTCKLCHDIEKKQRRYGKMWRDVERWQREGNRTATIERTCGEMQEVSEQIRRLSEEHDRRLQSLGQVSDGQERQVAVLKGSIMLSKFSVSKPVAQRSRSSAEKDKGHPTQPERTRTQSVAL